MMDIHVLNETRITKVEDAEKALMRGDFNEAMMLFVQIANLSRQMSDGTMADRFLAKAARMKSILDSMMPEEQEIYAYEPESAAGMLVYTNPGPESGEENCHQVFMRINKIERHLMDLDLMHLNGEMDDREYKARRNALQRIRNRLETSM